MLELREYGSLWTAIKDFVSDSVWADGEAVLVDEVEIICELRLQRGRVGPRLKSGRLFHFRKSRSQESEPKKGASTNLVSHIKFTKVSCALAKEKSR